MGYIDINLKILVVPKGGNMMDHFRHHFLEWILMIQENVDPSFIVFAYLPKDLAHKSDALYKPKDHGKTLSNIQKYANNVRPQMKEQISYMNLQVGFDAEPIEEVIRDMHAVSQGKAQVYKSPLQAAFTEQIGWLMPSYKGQSLKETEDFINGMIEQIHTGHAVMPKYPVQNNLTDPPKVALIFKPIFDGMSKRERDEKGLKLEPVFGTHVIACCSQKAIISMLIDYILALPTFAAANKLNTLMIPVYNCSSGLLESDKVEESYWPPMVLSKYHLLNSSAGSPQLGHSKLKRSDGLRIHHGHLT